MQDVTGARHGGGRRRAVRRIAPIAFAGLLLGGVVGAACGGDDTDQGTPGSEGIADTDAITTPLQPTGTETSPVPLGTRTEVGEWRLAVVSFVPDATSEVMAASGGDGPTVPGSVYALARVQATYAGSRAARDGGVLDTDSELRVGIQGSDDERYLNNNCGASEPDSMGDQPRVGNGDTVEGNFCIEVPAGVSPTSVFVAPIMRNEITGDSYTSDMGWWLATG